MLKRAGWRQTIQKALDASETDEVEREVSYALSRAKGHRANTE